VGRQSASLQTVPARRTTSRRVGFTQRAKQATATAAPIPGSKTKCQLNNHFAVAYLWGAPNRTVVPMFLQQLVVVDQTLSRGTSGKLRLAVDSLFLVVAWSTLAMTSSTWQTTTCRL